MVTNAKYRPKRLITNERATLQRALLSCSNS